jgi:hypothetical protein
VYFVEEATSNLYAVTLGEMNIELQRENISS